MKNILFTIILTMASATAFADKVNIILPKKASNRVGYAAEYLQKHLEKQGFDVVVSPKKDAKADHFVTLSAAKKLVGKKEGFTILAENKTSKNGTSAIISVVAHDGAAMLVQRKINWTDDGWPTVEP